MLARNAQKIIGTLSVESYSINVNCVLIKVETVCPVITYLFVFVSGSFTIFFLFYEASRHYLYTYIYILHLHLHLYN